MPQIGRKIVGLANTGNWQTSETGKESKPNEKNGGGERTAIAGSLPLLAGPRALHPNSCLPRLMAFGEGRDVEYDPKQPQPSPFPLKSFPALALANEPPTVPLAAPASPVVAASARGFSRSAAGLPWANSASSVSSPQPSKAGWSPFTTESASRFRPHTDGRERLLNHQRLVLEGQPQVFSLPTVEHVAPPSRRAFANAFQSSPRGVALEGSFRDSVSKSWSL